MDLISICIPTYNRPKLLGLLLDSILIQSYQNFEIIITDNSEGMDTRDLITMYYRDKRIRYYKNTSNLGMDGNTLRALDLIKGDYFTFTPDDDIWLCKNKLSTQHRHLKLTSLNVAFSNAHHIYLNGQTHSNQFSSLCSSGTRVIQSDDLLIQNKPQNFICILTGLIHKKYLDIFKLSWQNGSEELFMWYLGGIGEEIVYTYDKLVALRDGQHNWQIINDEGVLINFRNDSLVRANQLFNIYKILIYKYSEILPNLNYSFEMKLSKILFKLIGIKSLSKVYQMRHIGKFSILILLNYFLIWKIYKKIQKKFQ